MERLCGAIHEVDYSGVQYALMLGKRVVKAYRNKHAAVMRKRELGGEYLVFDTLAKKVIA